MNILLISPYFSPAVGGVETHLTDLCTYLSSKKHTVFVRTYKAFGVRDRGKIYEESKYLKIHRLSWPDFNLIFRLENYPILKFAYLFSGLFLDCLIFLIISYKKINVIQAHGFIAAMAAVLLGKLFKKRVVINTHVAFKLNNNFITNAIKWTLLNSDQILVLTQDIKTALIRIGIPANKIIIYHYWVNQKIFNIQKSSRKKLNWQNKFTVLFVGRLIEVKGIKTIFYLAKNLRNVKFVIVGIGPLAEEIKQACLGFKNIEFLGKIDNKNLPIYYSASSVLLIPSKIIDQEYEEGIPRVLIEALSCGLPIISTHSGGISNVFSKEMGLLIDDNLEDMVTAIKRMHNRRRTRKSIRDCSLKLFGIKNARIIEKSLQKDS